MTKLQRIEQEISELAPDELSELRGWFAEFDAANWDAQFERDAKAGKLDALADAALAVHRAGRTRPM